MKLNIIAVGQRPPVWVSEAFVDYAKRFSAELNVRLTEIPLRKRTSTADINRLMHQEGTDMLKHIASNSLAIALDVQGQSWSTPVLVTQLNAWMQQGRDVNFVIGGPEGLAPACLDRADKRWSLSALTLPHMLVRVILIETLYRAWSVVKGFPYHR
ncbi:MAG: 23S rRNA (pseudouridine(1915)-N(3))-methyltransferase RlmH [Gammaproteobacteria bacterium]